MVSGNEMKKLTHLDGWLMKQGLTGLQLSMFLDNIHSTAQLDVSYTLTLLRLSDLAYPITLLRDGRDLEFYKGHSLLMLGA